MIRTLLTLSFVVLMSVRVFAAADSVRFTCGEMLSRPTDHSITLNLCAEADIELFVEYGPVSGVYPLKTGLLMAQHDVPVTILLSGLQPDTRYFYRVQWRRSGTAEYTARTEHEFRTARSAGRTFSFAIEADPHMDTSTNAVLLKRTFTNILALRPDFMLDLGDTFMSDKLPVIDQTEVLKRNLLLRTVYDTVCHSVPLMMVQGNHDGELGWLNNGTPNNLAVWAANIRKSYYPQPFPDGFYSGDTVVPPFVGQRQNYYAWHWGNALFVVLDPYWYTVKKPGSTKNNWDWTLGRVQYDWFTRTLQENSAPFTFVFAHQIVGGVDLEGRGGIEGAPYYEMGGRNADSSWGFAVNRPGWPLPLHQLMVQHHVTAFFHGHDHVYVRQELDGIVYQEVPQPGYFNFVNPDKSYSNTGLAASYGYQHGTILSSSGFLSVTVSDSAATVEYRRTYLPEHENASRKNGAIAATYSVRRAVTSVHAGTLTTGSFGLRSNYPNPFNPSTTVPFVISQDAMVRLTVYDLLGRTVRVLFDGPASAGNHEVQFDAAGLSGGTYFCRLTAEGRTDVRRVLLLQ